MNAKGAFTPKEETTSSNPLPHASQTRKSEKFTERRHISGKTMIKERIKAECKELGVNLGITEEEWLKSFTLRAKVTRPLLQVEIGLNAVPDLAQATVDYLSTQEVETVEGDVDVLQRVLTLQVKAKVAKARALTHADSQLISNPFLVKTVIHLRQTVASIGLYLDQIGMFEHDGQPFIPKLAVPGLLPAPPTGFRRTELVLDGRRLYIPEQIMDPFACSDNQRLYVDETNLLNLDATIDEYSRFLVRVARKLRNAIRIVDFTNPKGTVAQLVGSRPILHSGRNYLKTWCTRDVPIEILQLGGGFKFGFNSQAPIHSESVCCVNWLMDNSSFMTAVTRANARM